MEKIAKDCGCVVIQNGRIVDYEGGATDNGVVFKDYEAFKTGKGICYIGEFGLQELHQNLADLEFRHDSITDENDEDFLPDKEYEEDMENILAECGETRQSIIDQVREAFGDDYLMTDEQVAYFAEDVFGLADWACIATYLAENFEIDDCIDYDDKGFFNQLQHEAVKAGMTPKEYAESKGLKSLNIQ